VTGEAIMTVSAAVVALTQLLKWVGVKTRHAPLLVLVVSAVGVLVWAMADGPFGRHHLFSLFAGWIAVATSAAGVFGFTRASGDGLIGAAKARSKR
jgi:hypothetical protein